MSDDLTTYAAVHAFYLRTLADEYPTGTASIAPANCRRIADTIETLRAEVERRRAEEQQTDRIIYGLLEILTPDADEALLVIRHVAAMVEAAKAAKTLEVERE